MDLISIVLSTLLFAAFVPGVIGTYPKGASKGKVLLTHAVAFAVVASIVMKMYWSMKERMTNWGDRCPNGFTMGVSKDGKPDCVPTGSKTYEPFGFLGLNSSRQEIPVQRPRDSEYDIRTWS